MPDPWNPHRATPEPAPIVPPHRRKGRKSARRAARSREPRESSQPPRGQVGEVDRRGAFGVMLDAVSGREPHEKPADQRVPETETKRRRRQLARNAAQPKPRRAKP